MCRARAAYYFNGHIPKRDERAAVGGERSEPSSVRSRRCSGAQMMNAVTTPRGTGGSLNDQGIARCAANLDPETASDAFYDSIS
jgi:hypothetical protein